MQQGLQSEWRAIWGDDGSDSLKAGAVAYRTYAAYFEQHPGRSGSPLYDIRSDECNQAFNVTGFPPDWRTSAAAQATAGIAVSDNGATAYFSEYASNTNHAPPGHSGSYYWPGCPDGQTGDGANWPCMNDPAATGSTFLGHGRGMSQYGSWYWARGKSYQSQTTFTAPGWQCILDHYYNDNGNSTGAGANNTSRYSFLYGPGGDGLIAYAPSPPPQPGLPSTRNAGSTTPADECSPGVTADIYTMFLDGTNLFDVTPNQCNGSPAWAPTQKQIVYDTGGQVSIINSDRTGNRTLGYGGWSPDPDWSRENVIVYGNWYGLYSVNPDGSNGFQINNIDTFFWSASWSPTGSQIAYVLCYPDPSPVCPTVEIAVVNADGTGQRILTAAPANNWDPSWSPDGSSIVYVSDATGTTEIWVMGYDGSLPIQLTHFSMNTNASPHWSQDGHFIIWLTSTPQGPQEYTISLNIMGWDGSNQYSYGPSLPTVTGGGGATMNTSHCRRFETLSGLPN